MIRELAIGLAVGGLLASICGGINRVVDRYKRSTTIDYGPHELVREQLWSAIGKVFWVLGILMLLASVVVFLVSFVVS